jgi:hypothetical protein
MVGNVARPVQQLDPGWVKRITKTGMHSDGGGLYLQVSRFGTKSWIYRYMLDGRRREMGLGPYPVVSLAVAREKAAECRSVIKRDHIDPVAARKAQRDRARLDAAKTITFRQCAEAYIAAHSAGWRNPKHRAQWPSTLGAYVYPVFGSLPVQAIDVALVMKAIEAIWMTKPETASRVRGRIESVLDWAAARGYRQGENPARWRGHIDKLLPQKSKVRRVKHHAALAYAEIGQFMADLRQEEGIAARAPFHDPDGRASHRWDDPRRMAGNRLAGAPMDDSGRTHEEGREGIQGAAQRRCDGASGGNARDPPKRLHLSRRQARATDQRHGNVGGVAPDGRARDRPRLSLDF